MSHRHCRLTVCARAAVKASLIPYQETHVLLQRLAIRPLLRSHLQHAPAIVCVATAPTVHTLSMGAAEMRPHARLGSRFWPTPLVTLIRPASHVLLAPLTTTPMATLLACSALLVNTQTLRRLVRAATLCARSVRSTMTATQAHHACLAQACMTSSRVLA